MTFISSSSNHSIYSPTPTTNKGDVAALFSSPTGVIDEAYYFCQYDDQQDDEETPQLEQQQQQQQPRGPGKQHSIIKKNNSNIISSSSAPGASQTSFAAAFAPLPLDFDDDVGGDDDDRDNSKNELMLTKSSSSADGKIELEKQKCLGQQRATRGPLACSYSSSSTSTACTLTSASSSSVSSSSSSFVLFEDKKHSSDNVKTLETRSLHEYKSTTRLDENNDHDYESTYKEEERKANLGAFPRLPVGGRPVRKGCRRSEYYKSKSMPILNVKGDDDGDFGLHHHIGAAASVQKKLNMSTTTFTTCSSSSTSLSWGGDEHYTAYHHQQQSQQLEAPSLLHPRSRRPQKVPGPLVKECSWKQRRQECNDFKALVWLRQQIQLLDDEMRNTSDRQTREDLILQKQRLVQQAMHKASPPMLF